MLNVESILKGKYPAKAHARRVAEYLVSKGHPKDGVIYLEAQRTHMIEDNDEPVLFRQRRPFFYLSGCNLPDAHLTYNIPQDILTLFIPPIDPDSVVWTGLPMSTQEALKKYDVDQVHYTSEVNAALAAYQHTKSTTVYAIPEQVSTHVSFLGFAKTELGVLKKAIEDTRVVKDEYEAAMLAKANQISTLAHNAVVRAGTKGQERERAMGNLHRNLHSQWGRRAVISLHCCLWYSCIDTALSAKQCAAGGQAQYTIGCWWRVRMLLRRYHTYIPNQRQILA